MKITGNDCVKTNNGSQNLNQRFRNYKIKYIYLLSTKGKKNEQKHK